MKSYQSPPTAPTGIESPDTVKPGIEGARLREKRLLNDAGFASLASHLLPLPLFLLKPARVVDGHCHIAAHGLQQPQLARVEGIQFVVRGGEYSHQLPFHMQRNRNLRECGFFTANVVGVLAHIGRVVHLAGGSDVSDHSFANFQTVSGAAEVAATAAMSAHQRQFAALLVVQVDVRIQTSERTGNLVYDLIDQLIEVKDGADFLSGLLQLEKILHLIEIEQGRVRGRQCGEIWTGGHRVYSKYTTYGKR